MHTALGDDDAGVGRRRAAPAPGDRRRVGARASLRATIAGVWRARSSNGRCPSPARAATTTRRPRPAASRSTEIDPSTMESRVVPGAVSGRRDARRRRPHRRLQLPVGVVERVRRRPRAAARIDTSALSGPTLTCMHRPFLFWGFKSSQEILENSLGALEREVMAIVWSTARSASATPARSWTSPVAYTTVMTTMDRLFKKGLLARRKVGPRVPVQRRRDARGARRRRRHRARAEPAAARRQRAAAGAVVARRRGVGSRPRAARRARAADSREAPAVDREKAR